ncbi:FAD-dependent oxidoreductase [Roseobacter sp.]|uniref:NAD(P)/FAD-dependent oxidoreductase n=1 Tax=Roseobacter sp. TaxID=1907202 RepID=UPI003298DB1E
MTRIFSDYAYGAGPRDGCWWDKTCKTPTRPTLEGSKTADVAIVGAGFTGLSAALHLAKAGLSVRVLDTHFPGWGASGRNGGFCCLGGGMLEDAELDAEYGLAQRLAFRKSEKAAVALVTDLIDEYQLDVDRHSSGETELAHRPKDMAALRDKAQSVLENYGVTPSLIEQHALEDHGLGREFFGALTIPIGFGLNPLRYVSGLARAAECEGAIIHHHTNVTSIHTKNGRYALGTQAGTVHADHTIIATNGYSSEDIPADLAGRYMPGQSNVLVTRPLNSSEIERQGWFSDQMCFDTRHLLHYFRLMPDRRFLFGMRGGLLSGPSAEARSHHRIRREFCKMFPEWADVDVTHMWSGMVCLSRNRMPFIGELANNSNMWAGLCYHGNGVAMGTLGGKILAELIQGIRPRHYSEALRNPLKKFPLGRGRRALMPPLYLALMASDMRP